MCSRLKVLDSLMQRVQDSSWLGGGTFRQIGSEEFALSFGTRQLQSTTKLGQWEEFVRECKHSLFSFDDELLGKS